MAERKIGSRVYRYDPQPGAEGLRLLLRAVRLLAPAAGLLETIASGDEDAEPAALMAAVEGMDPDGITTLLTGLVSQTREDGRLIDDTHGVMSREEFCAVAMFALQTELGWFLREGPGAAIRKAGLVPRAPDRIAG